MAIMKSLKFSFLLIWLILFSLPLPTTALESCNDKFCYDDDLPINVGDIFNWNYTKTSSSYFDASRTIHKGLPSNLFWNSSGLIQIEILKDIRGISELDYSQGFFDGDPYFNVSISVEGTRVPDIYEIYLYETNLIYPIV